MTNPIQSMIHVIGVPLYIVDVEPGERSIFAEGNQPAELYYGISSDENSRREMGDFDGMDRQQILQRKDGF
jgi:hypothetical protein